MSGAFSNVASGGTITTDDGCARFTVLYAGQNTVQLTDLVVLDRNCTTAGTDSDGDGMSDASELIAGTDPNDGNSRLRIFSSVYDAELTSVTITFALRNTTRLYRLEHAAHLAGPWIDSSLGTFAPDTGAITARTFSLPPGPRRFFHVVVINPEP